MNIIDEYDESHWDETPAWLIIIQAEERYPDLVEADKAKFYLEGYDASDDSYNCLIHSFKHGMVILSNEEDGGYLLEEWDTSSADEWRVSSMNHIHTAMEARAAIANWID